MKQGKMGNISQKPLLFISASERYSTRFLTPPENFDTTWPNIFHLIPKINTEGIPWLGVKARGEEGAVVPPTPVELGPTQAL
jgi:hypothetical protein